MTRQIQRLAGAFLAAFFGLAVISGYWTVVRQAALLSRGDNPRRLLAERRSPRGALYDRNGASLAESVGPPGAYTRWYPYPALAPVLGYVSPVYGLAGLEASADTILHGEASASPWAAAWEDLLSTPPAGRAVRLTLDLKLQQLADAALGDSTGAVVVLDAASGEILALASHPGFDPNTLDADWPALVADTRAPLLNRATAALYQPGGALAPALLAAARQANLVNAAERFPALDQTTASLPNASGCQAAPTARLTLPEALAADCPGPLAEAGRRLGSDRLQQLFTDLRLLEAPALGLPTVAAAPAFTDPAALATGQGALTLTPLHLALVTAALARRGELPAPSLIQAVQAPDGSWTPAAPAGHSVAAFAPETAETVKAWLRAGHSASALAGGRQLAWFAGFAPFDAPRRVVVVLLEAGEAATAAQIGRALLSAAP